MFTRACSCLLLAALVSLLMAFSDKKSLSAPLPQKTSFAAGPQLLISWEKAGLSARLQFTTSDESGVCCYEWEKSEDGISYSTIAAFPATGKKNIPVTYTHTDLQAKEQVQFYRIRIIFTNKTSRYTAAQALRTITKREVLLYPNPTPGILNIELRNASVRMITVVIINQNGKELLTRQAPVSGNGAARISVSELPPGVYFADIRATGFQKTRSFIKI
jgi:Secretion system C-terminal sorting domain